MLVTELTGVTFDGFVRGAGGVVLVVFRGGGCSRCRELVPVVRELAIGYLGLAAFSSVNVDLEPELASAFGVATLPTIIGFRDGLPSAMITSRCGREEIIQMVDGLRRVAEAPSGVGGREHDVEPCL